MSTITTDSDGCYSFDFGEKGAGYYTIEMIKEGYKTSTFNVTVSGKTTEQDGDIESNTDSEDPENGDVPIDEKHFPDENFRSYIREWIDKNNDGILSNEEIQKVTFIVARSSNIESLEGVEYFTALKELNILDNKITKLDVSKNIALEELSCLGNQLTILDVSKNVNLRKLYCYNNSLKELNIGENNVLRMLSCHHNQLTTLDVSKARALWQIWCNDNQLTSLNIGENTVLTYLDCRNNQLTTLDLSSCSNLNKNDVKCDNNVQVNWPVSSSSTPAPTQMPHSRSLQDSNTHSIHSDIVAFLPEFKADYSGTYSFDVSFDVEAPSGFVLVMRLSSGNEGILHSDDVSCAFFDEDGSQIEMPLTNNVKCAKVSAYFKAGVNYSPNYYCAN